MAEPHPLSPIAASGLRLGDRQRQEDAVAYAMPDGSDLGFAILSDGMGGHAAGDLASHMIVSEVFAELTVRCRNVDPRCFDVPTVLRHAVSEANDCLHAHIVSRPAERGMGGTLVIVVIWRGQLYWASVGDSLLYLYREGSLRRLNADHSMAPQLDLMVAKGLISADAAARHPHRSCLTSAIIGETLTEVDCPEEPVALQPGDVVVLASDGLLTLTQQAATELLQSRHRGGALHVTRGFLDAIDAAAAPEQDNTSMITIQMPEAQEGPVPGLWQRLRRHVQTRPEPLAAERPVP